jgi:hypothetical protein
MIFIDLQKGLVDTLGHYVRSIYARRGVELPKRRVSKSC